MSSSNAHTNVTHLNYELLVQFRELLKESPAEAGLRFHVPLDAGRKLLACTHEQLKSIASSGRLVFAFDVQDIPNAPSH
jgi:hypothetical protein